MPQGVREGRSCRLPARLPACAVPAPPCCTRIRRARAPYGACAVQALGGVPCLQALPADGAARSGWLGWVARSHALTTAAQHCATAVPQGQYILDAGLEAGLELPYTCKGGICGCCVGRISSGTHDDSDVSRAALPDACPLLAAAAACSFQRTAVLQHELAAGLHVGTSCKRSSGRPLWHLPPAAHHCRAAAPCHTLNAVPLFRPPPLLLSPSPQIADLTFVLTQDEIDNKLTMLCMCRPVSDVVYVETQVRAAGGRGRGACGAGGAAHRAAAGAGAWAAPPPLTRGPPAARASQPLAPHRPRARAVQLGLQPGQQRLEGPHRLHLRQVHRPAHGPALAGDGAGEGQEGGVSPPRRRRCGAAAAAGERAPPAPAPAGAQRAPPLLSRQACVHYSKRPRLRPCPCQPFPLPASPRFPQSLFRASHRLGGPNRAAGAIYTADLSSHCKHTLSSGSLGKRRCLQRRWRVHACGDGNATKCGP